MIYDGLLITRKKIQKYLDKAKKDLKTRPQGSLRVCTVNKKPYYYLRKSSKDTNGKIIGHNNIKLAKELAQKEYEKKLVSILGKELNRIDKFIENTNQQLMSDVLNGISIGKRRLVTPYEISDKEYAKQWQAVKNPGNDHTFYDTNFYTNRNERVRSNSEVTIANMLNEYNVPYRYEYPLFFDNMQDYIHPDFTVLNVKTRKEYFIEYFGMMDDEKYRGNALHRIEQYAAEGYLLGDSLIAIFGERYYQLNPTYFKEIIKHYFL